MVGSSDAKMLSKMHRKWGFKAFNYLFDTRKIKRKLSFTVYPVKMQSLLIKTIKSTLTKL